MIPKLLDFLRGQPRLPLRELVDPVLGRCVPEQEERWWEATVKVGDQTIGFTLGGDLEPDPALLEHARQIVAELDAFRARVAAFLAGEAAGTADPIVRAEIEILQIEEVCLFWPDEPGDGVIYFAGPSEDRVWRCDYVEKQCRDLACDS
jgi:hypothetical protein